MLLVSVIVFVLISLTGDPAALLVSQDSTLEEIEEFRHMMGFDRDPLTQYVLFLGRAIQGDFGESLRWRQPAMKIVLERVPNSMKLTLVAVLITLFIAIPVGLMSAIWRNSLFDNLSYIILLIAQSAPPFWLGGMLILLFSVKLRILPTFGGDSLAHLILPGFTLALFSIVMVARLLRSSILDILSAGYIRTARGKGLPERLVILRHVLKNAAIPVVTVVGVQVGTLLGGIVVIEYVFGYPGIGRLLFQAVSYKDIPVIEAIIILIAFSIVLINILVDFFYTLLDPRIRLE